MPNPLPWNGTQTSVMRKKQDAGWDGVGAFSRCQVSPGLGELVVHFEGPLSMSSKKLVVVPDVTVMSSSVQPVKAAGGWLPGGPRSGPKRKLSVMGRRHSL